MTMAEKRGMVVITCIVIGRICVRMLGWSFGLKGMRFLLVACLLSHRAELVVCPT